jgi:hypothetical protein
VFRKHDQNKAQYHHILPGFEEALARVMEHGAEKYGDFNYLHGCAWSRYGDALRRHWRAWLDGEDLDDESGEHHLAHLTACAMILWAMQQANVGEDDRPGAHAERIMARLAELDRTKIEALCAVTELNGG